MSNRSLTHDADNMKTITITYEITNTSLEVMVFRDFTIDHLPDMYGILIREVYCRLFFKNSISFLIKQHILPKIEFPYTSGYFDLLSIIFNSIASFD